MPDPEMSFALVIEPDARERHTAARLLEDLGFAVFATANVREACALDAAVPALDLIVSGVPLAEGTDGSTVAELADRWPGAVLLYASPSTSEQRRRVRGITNLVVLPKPLARGDVRSALALASRRSVS